MLSPLTSELRDELLELGAATLYEAAGGQGAIDPVIQAVWSGARVCGRALPVACATGDNLAIHLAVERCTGGEVLVATAGGHLAGYCGEVLAVACQARGAAGLLIDGGVRDRDAIERLGFPVFARGVSMRSTVKHESGRVGEPVIVGGVQVHPGDVVVGDADGAVVVTADRLDEVLDKARARVERERVIIARLRQGDLTLDLLGIRPKM